MAYTVEQIITLSEEYEKWVTREEVLIERVLIHAYDNETSHNLAAQGLVRRIKTLARCMERVYNLVPLDAEAPARENIDDAAIFLQSFILNVYGAIDNLARLWVLETGLTKPNGGEIPRSWMGLGPSCEIVRQSLPEAFREYLTAADHWFEYLENYRHALAHRIPLYIPPKRMKESEVTRYHELQTEKRDALRAHEFDKFHELNGEETALGVFEPWMMHSYGPAEEDGQPVRFHPQMICDFGTVVELCEKIMDQLEALSAE